jgi:hypothetical protein
MVSYKKIEELRNIFLKNNPHQVNTWFDDDKGGFHNMFNGLNLKKGNKALYIGTGSAFGTYVASEAVGINGEVVSYDTDINVMRKAKKNLGHVDKKNNVSLIIGDGTSQPHKKAYFDRVLVAAGCRLEIPDKGNYIMKKDLVENSFLKQLSEQTKTNGIIVMPMGKLHCRWDTECFADVYKIKNLEDRLHFSKIKQNSMGFWIPLVGEKGFSEEEMRDVYLKEGSLCDDAL